MPEVVINISAKDNTGPVFDRIKNRQTDVNQQAQKFYSQASTGTHSPAQIERNAESLVKRKQKYIEEEYQTRLKLAKNYPEALEREKGKLSLGERLEARGISTSEITAAGNWRQRETQELEEIRKVLESMLGLTEEKPERDKENTNALIEANEKAGRMGENESQSKKGEKKGEGGDSFREKKGKKGEKLAHGFYGTVEGGMELGEAGGNMIPQGMGMGAAGLARLGPWGVAAAAIALAGGKMVGTGQTLHKAVGGIYALNKEETLGTNYIENASKHGLSGSDYINQYVLPSIKARGNAGNEASNVENARLFALGSDAMGIEKSSMIQSMKLSRFNPGSSWSGDIGQLKTMMGMGNDVTMLSEYLDVANQLSQEQIGVMEKISPSMSNAIVAKLGGLDAFFKQPEVIRQTVSGLQGGLTNASTPYAKAIQFATLARLNPGESRIGLLEKMQGGMYTPGYLEGVFKNLKQYSGKSQDRMIENVVGMFPGLNIAAARKLVENYKKDGTLDFSSLSQTIGKVPLETAIPRDMLQIVSATEVAGSKITEKLEVISLQLVKILSQMLSN